MVNNSNTVETAFSRMNKSRRKVYGTAGEEDEEQQTLLTANDFLTTDKVVAQSVSLFGGDDDQHTCSDEENNVVDPVEELGSSDANEDSAREAFHEGNHCERMEVSPVKQTVLEIVHDDIVQESTDLAKNIDVDFNNEAEEHVQEQENEKDADNASEDARPRRSMRSRKSTLSIPKESFVPQVTLDTGELLTQTTDEQPDDDCLIASIDNLFIHADKETVTIKDIVVALEAEYGVKISKTTKLFVRERLKDLVQGTVEPTVAGNEKEEESDSEEEDEEEEAEDSEPDFEQDEGYDSDEDIKKPKKVKKSKKTGIKKESKTERKSTRRPLKQKKPSALRIHAEMLRKKRMDELRVRQEELQMEQNKEEQERAELIAARFDTNTEELKLKRLEDRLDLLQKLDQKRIQVVTGECNPHKSEKTGNDAPSTAGTSDSDSESDMELEIVESVNNKAVEPLQTTTAATNGNNVQLNASSILSRINDGQLHSKKAVEKADISWSEVAVNAQSSPGKSLSARALLRRTLLSKQRRMGNLWLARELGYKSEQDHLRDCLQAEEQKRNQVIKIEEARLKANGRKQLRERMLLANTEEVFGDQESDEEEEEWKPFEDSTEANHDDDDEELALAKAIENEGAEASEASDTLDGNTNPDDMPDDADEKSTTAETDRQDRIVAIENCENLSTELELVERPSQRERIDKITLKPPKEALNRPLQGDNLEERTGSSIGDDGHTEFYETSSSDPQVETNESETEVPTTESIEEFSAELVDHDAAVEKPRKAKNSGWQEMLRKEAEQLKKLKSRKGSGLVEAEADEEEEDDVVAGLEDFGFSMGKKKKDDDDEEGEIDDELDEDDLKHVVDDLSDDEGDEEAGERARKELMKRDEKEQHKEMLRRMREGYDGRRGGIAGGGVGARGLHRFDQLVAADNREDAKRLGLLNDDELDSDDEDKEKSDSGKDDDVDDEVALLDKMLKDRFLHRSSVEMEEDFSDDEEEDDERDGAQNGPENEEDAEEREQERLAKRFAKRARMQRLLEAHGDDEEFSQLRLIEEDQRMKQELMSMKDVAGLTRRQVSVSSTSQSAFSNQGGECLPGSSSNSQGMFTSQASGSLVLALTASRQRKNKTSFLGGGTGNKDRVSAIHKSVTLSHVVFHTENSQSLSAPAPSVATCKRKRTVQTSSSLWDKVASNSFRKSQKRY